MTELFKKLNFKDQDPILVLGAPTAFEPELKLMAGETAIHRGTKSGMTYAFILAFAPMRADLMAAAKTVQKAAAAAAVLWFAYPKQTSPRYTSDLNRDLCAAALKPLHFQPVRQVAIDDDWSALRFKTAP